MHQAVLVVAGSHAPGTVFKLYKWSGVLTVLPYPNTKDVQILFDDGDGRSVGSGEDAPVASVFRDAILTVD